MYPVSCIHRLWSHDRRRDRNAPIIIIIIIIGDKTVVNAALRDMYPLVARPGYLYAATCVWCKRGFSRDVRVSSSGDGQWIRSAVDWFTVISRRDLHQSSCTTSGVHLTSADKYKKRTNSTNTLSGFQDCEWCATLLQYRVVQKTGPPYLRGTLSHCKYSEKFMTELRGNWWTSAILYAEHSH